MSEDFDLDAAVDSPPECQPCRGTGVRQMHTRGPALFVACPNCGGNGTTDPSASNPTQGEEGNAS